MPHGIVDKVANHPGQRNAVADGATRLDVCHDLHRSDCAQPAGLGLEQVVEIHVVVPQVGPVLVGAGQQQQIFDQLVHAARFGQQRFVDEFAVHQLGPADASSSAVVIVVNGLRSSWEASLTSRSWAARPFSSRPSMAFIVVASWAISSRAPGTGTRCARSALEIDATRARIASTGRTPRRPADRYPELSTQ